MKKIYFLLVAAAMSFAACNGLGINPEGPDDNGNSNPELGIKPGDEKPVPTMEMTTYTATYEAGPTAETKTQKDQEAMALAPQASNNMLREVLACLCDNFKTPEAAAPRRSGIADVPYVYDEATDVLTIDYGKTATKGFEGLMCSGKAEVYNAKFILVKGGTVTVKSTDFTVEGMTFIGQFTAKTTSVVAGMPNKVEVNIPSAFVKSGLMMSQYVGKMNLELLADGLKVGGMDVTIKTLFGNFNLKTASSLLFKAAELPVDGELNVTMSKAVKYTYDKKEYSVDNFSIVFAPVLANTEFGFMYEGKGFKATYAELCKDYADIVDMIGVYLNVLFGVK